MPEDQNVETGKGSQGTGGAEATTGDGQETKCTPPPCQEDDRNLPCLAAESQFLDDCTVTVFAGRSPDSECPGPFTNEFKKLPDVELTLGGTGTGPGAYGSRSNDKGVATFKVPPGEYQLYASPLPNYKSPALWVPKPTSKPDACGSGAASTEPPEADDQEKHDLPFSLPKLSAGDAVSLYLVFAPRPATVNISAYYQSKRPAGRAPIDSVPISFEHEGVTISPGVTTPIKSYKAEGYATVPPANLTSQINKMGLVTLKAPRQITAGGKKLQLHSPGSNMLQIDPGGIYDVQLPYIDQLAELQLAAYLKAEPSGQTDPTKAECCGKASSVSQRVLLPDVQFLIYQGTSVTGDVYRQAQANGLAPAVVSGLEPRQYTVVASAKSYLGQPIESVDPCGGVATVILASGQDVMREFVFAPCPSAASGRVTDSCGTGIPGVGVTLTPMDRSFSPRTAISDLAGNFSFPDVPRGSHMIGIHQAKIRMPDGTTWETSPEAQKGHQITMTRGVTQVPTFTLAPEVHKLSGKINGSDGKPLAHWPVDILDFRDQKVATVQTNQNGYYEWNAQSAGTYYVSPQTPAGYPRSKRPALVNSEVLVEDIILSFAPGTGGLGGPPPGGGAGAGPRQAEARDVADLQSFPVLTQDFSPAALPSASTPGPSAPIGGTSALGLAADKAIREVLSWRTKGDDPKGFLGALNQAFDLKEVEGHTEFTWTPRSYTVQTDMGAVTGAQASIYARAKVALDQSMPLLSGLYPLTPNVEAEDLATAQAVVRSQFTALVNEFGVVGGPRVPRVDELFDLLLSRQVTEHRDQRPDPERIHRSGSLGLVRERFGIERRAVVSVDDEQNLTNYLILVDYVIGLWESWNYYRDFFVRTFLGETERRPFFGTQLVLISRALEVVAQGVQDAYYTMDSVFMGDAERQTTQLDFANLNPAGISIPDGRGGRELLQIIDPKSGLFVAELLDWVYRAASDELPALLQDAGKDGIESFLASTDRLRRFVHAAIVPPQRAPALPPGYFTPRVQRALQLLADGLDEAYGLAQQVRQPDLPVEFSAEDLRDLRELLRKSGVRR